MKSKIYLNEVVANKDRQFGEAVCYYPIKVVLEDGTVERALFTKSQIEIALMRAETNEEDFPKKNLLELIFE